MIEQVTPNAPTHAIQTFMKVMFYILPVAKVGFQSRRNSVPTSRRNRWRRRRAPYSQ